MRGPTGYKVSFFGWGMPLVPLAAVDLGNDFMFWVSRLGTFSQRFWWVGLKAAAWSPAHSTKMQPVFVACNFLSWQVNHGQPFKIMRVIRKINPSVKQLVLQNSFFLAWTARRCDALHEMVLGVLLAACAYTGGTHGTQLPSVGPIFWCHLVAWSWCNCSIGLDSWTPLDMVGRWS